MGWKLEGSHFENCSCEMPCHRSGRSGFSAPFSWSG